MDTVSLDRLSPMDCYSPLDKKNIQSIFFIDLSDKRPIVVVKSTGNSPKLTD
jgi:hypothetical protein